MDYQEKAKIFTQIQNASRTQKNSDFFHEFLSIFLSEIPVEDLKEYTAENWNQIALHGVDFCNLPKAKDSCVKVYSPQEEIHEWPHYGTAIDIIHPHLPFLIDSLYAALVAEQHHISLFVHLLLKIKRSSGGELESISSGKTSDDTKELDSFLHIELEDQLSETERSSLQNILEAVIQDVSVAVQDWHLMRHRVQTCLQEIKTCPLYLNEDEREEQAFFLKWVDEGFFTFLGYRLYETKGGTAHENDLGITKTHKSSFFGPDEYTERNILGQTITTPPYFSITKTMVESKVHRPVPMDVIRITVVNKQGHIVGEHQFFGLFTAAVYNTRLQEIPLIRRKVSEIFKLCDVRPDLYEGRRLMYILESLPRDILFQVPVSEIANLVQAIRSLKERHRLSLFVLADPLGHFISSLVYIPRDRYTSVLAVNMGEILADCYKGALISHETHIGGDLSFARVHYLISTDAHPQHKIVCDIRSTELVLSDLSLSWEERLKKTGREEYKLDDRFLSGLFPAAYQSYFSVTEALKDVPFIQTALHSSSPTIHLYQKLESGISEIHLKIFSPGQSLFLSDVFPTLDHMGLRVLTEASYKSGEGSQTVWIHHFRAQPVASLAEPFEKIYSNFLHVLERVIHKKAENDSFNRLVMVGNLSYRHLLVVRAYYRYMRQIGWPFMRPIIVSAFERYPHILKKLGKLFDVQFNPDASYAFSEEEIFETLKGDLRNIDHNDDEAILSGFLTLIRATQRTNFFQKESTGEFKEYISLKFSPALIEPLQDTKPLYEVFVYAPWVEAIHLRTGKVSRGGIRWSDRWADYRKEVLELMKAQLVKNAIIIPMGAKGGFYVRTPIEHLPFLEKQEEVIRSYKTMIRGLLDITDNLIEGQIISPPLVKRRDDDDPYLVVAADKGTATFSDIANTLSQEYGFWLGDAFASGGSAGYDHKKMGITSRGAWESVKRHFRELGCNIEKPFTVIGVGDMSGDVFGNGLLYSDQIKLVAAFNHSHIFIDPEPNVSVSYEERKRLFNIPRSQWTDYNLDLISNGGGVFDRRSKIIQLSPQAQQLLQISESEVKPSSLIQAILKAPADLLWFGGIGTYVKERKENHMEVGDRTNDAVRINGHEVKARVIGEGANLALTQKGRIAYAQRGGKLNRDSVDNSAGVDCSDHEVNIKILFQDILKSGQIDENKRNKLLKEMTSEVAALVLRDNYLQTQAISLIESRGYKALARQNRLIRFFESKGILERELESLPSEDDVERRIEKKMGLTRPEISVLVSYSKLYLYEKILNSDLPESPFLQHYLMEYFPKILQEKYGSFIQRHPLKKELIATSEANFLVNRLGTTFLFELERRYEKPMEELIRFLSIIRGAFHLDWYWQAIESLDGKVPYQIQNKLLSLMILLNEKILEGALKEEIFSPWMNDPVAFKRDVEELTGMSQRQVSCSISEKDLENLEVYLNTILDDQSIPLIKRFVTFFNNLKENLL